VSFSVYQYKRAVGPGDVGTGIIAVFGAMFGCIIFIICCVVQWIFLLMTTFYCPSGFIMFSINAIVIIIVVIMLIYSIISEFVNNK